MAKASSSARQALIAFGQELGLACQIATDASGLAGGDTKLSVASVLGAQRASAQAEALAAQAASHLDLFDEKADLLRAAAAFVVSQA